MLLTDIFSALTMGPLSQHALGLPEDPEDPFGLPLHTDKLLTIINMGLSDLHKRFPIRKEEIILCTEPCTDRYVIAPNAPYLTGYPIQSEIVGILEVHDKFGRQCILNGLGRYNKPMDEYCTDNEVGDYGINLFLPAHNVIGTPKGYCDPLKVIYQSGALLVTPSMVDNAWDPVGVEVELPYIYMEALILYVCSKVFATMQPEQGYASTNTERSYYQQYQEECSRLHEQGHSIDGIGMSANRFNEKGFI